MSRLRISPELPSVRPKSVRCGPALQASAVPSIALKTRYGGFHSIPSSAAARRPREASGNLPRSFPGRTPRPPHGAFLSTPPPPTPPPPPPPTSPPLAPPV